MERYRSANRTADIDGLSVWYCRSCNLVHLSVCGNVVDVSVEEFRVFADRVIEAIYSIGPLPLIENKAAGQLISSHDSHTLTTG